MKAKVIGAGSIGNHLVQACRTKGLDVTVVDADPEALKRMKEDIYPSRYGQWDEEIKQFTSETAPVGGFDVILVGTPPDVHLKVAIEVLEKEAPRVLQVEKPLCTPTLELLPEFMAAVKARPETQVIVGYNHLLSAQSIRAEAILGDGTFELPVAIDCEFRSHWGGILGAHPWLSGPEETYLGYWKRGGGSGAEHSHGVNVMQFFMHMIGAGRIKTVSANIDIVKEGKAEYDRSFFIQITSETGLVGRLAQDVVTHPKKKFVSITHSNGALDWVNDVSKNTDEVRVNVRGKETIVEEIQKTRPEEFGREVDHIDDLLNGKISYKDSPLRLERGVETMLVLEAAFRSYQEGKVVEVDYSILD